VAGGPGCLSPLTSSQVWLGRGAWFALGAPASRGGMTAVLLLLASAAPCLTATAQAPTVGRCPVLDVCARTTLWLCAAHGAMSWGPCRARAAAWSGFGRAAFQVGVRLASRKCLKPFFVASSAPGMDSSARVLHGGRQQLGPQICLKQPPAHVCVCADRSPRWQQPSKRRADAQAAQQEAWLLSSVRRQALASQRPLRCWLWQALVSLLFSTASNPRWLGSWHWWHGTYWWHRT